MPVLSADLFRRIVLNLVPMVLSLTVHEFSHATVADWLGDDTPRRQGRLTLSPMAHYDVFGTFVVPIAAVIFGGGYAFIGWARPVEISPARLTRKLSMKTGSILVAIAGPLSNLLLAVISIGALAIIAHTRPDLMFEHHGAAGLVYLLRAMFIVNVGLCIFNLLPIPPLDGSRLLPRSLDELQRIVAPFSLIVILVILYSDSLRHWLIDLPMGYVTYGLERVFHVRVWGIG